jgi:hypothetical protein
MSDGLLPPPLDAETEALLADERGAPGAPPGARERVRGRVLASVAAGGASLVGSASGSHAAAGAVPKLLGPAALKLLLGVAAVAGVGAAALGIRHATSKPAAGLARPGASQRSVATPPATPPAGTAKDGAPSSDTRAAATKSGAPSSDTAATDAPAGGRGARDALAGERALLETARAALGRGDFARALTAAQRHERRWPRGQLAEEREALTVRALAASGQVDAARARAGAFRARFPRSIFLPAVDAASRPR